MIKASNLYKSFGEQAVLCGVNWKYRRRSGIILGEAVAAKAFSSTHVRFNQPDAGKFFIGDWRFLLMKESSSKSEDKWRHVSRRCSF
jgi:ABC-type polar amino acid transport system ATPase subunit